MGYLISLIVPDVEWHLSIIWYFRFLCGVAVQERKYNMFPIVLLQADFTCTGKSVFSYALILFALLILVWVAASSKIESLNKLGLRLNCGGQLPSLHKMLMTSVLKLLLVLNQFVDGLCADHVLKLPPTEICRRRMTVAMLGACR